MYRGSAPVKNRAWIDTIGELIVTLDDSCLNKIATVMYIKSGSEKWEARLYSRINEHTVKVTHDGILPLGVELELIVEGVSIPIYPRSLVRSDWFEEHYTDSEAALGAECSEEGTSFTMWAPTATKVMLYLNNNKKIMSRKKKGIWNLYVVGDWHGAEYEYEITVNGKKNRVIDPYTKALLPNSSKGVVINPAAMEHQDYSCDRPKIKDLQDSIIYELHVRDATIFKDSGVVHKGKFLGLTESDIVTSAGYSSGLSYFKQLGVTHIQLLPINDFAKVDELNPEKNYNWGYDPLFYQAPEGSYSCYPEDPISRIHECKNMIEALHQAGLGVIIDVVYNHVYKWEESSFENIVPGYYFRYFEDGSISNGTGVGNDIATERKMVRKFILDTIDYWLKEFKVDGFRFDLMGIMDIGTMREIRSRCSQENVPIMLLGEGWDLNTALPADQKATSYQSQHLPGIRFFNDYFRDTLKGNNFDVYDVGYVNGKGRFIERLPQLVSGCALEDFGETFVARVTQTVNYVECHDNHTLWDRLALSNSHETIQDRKKMHQLATGITLLSQGVPFLHAGQEWFRTKYGDENSYISSDEVNQLNWKARETEKDNITFIKQLIQIRKNYPVFRMTRKEDVKRRLHILHTPAPVFGWTLFGDEEDIAIYVNPTKRRFQLHLPSTGKWDVICSNGDKGNSHIIRGEFTFIEPYEMFVVKKNRRG